MRIYRRHLPHRDVSEVPAFVTWRLRNSLPPERIFHPEHLTSGEVFLAWDRLLDETRGGATYLGQPEIAGMVVEQLKTSAAGALCTLEAYVVMPNHVHVLWTPLTSLPELVRRVKGATAFRANRLLGLAGSPFWQEEYFDRIVRSQEEFDSIRRYIEGNPVKAGLVASPEDFPWSSAWRG